MLKQLSARITFVSIAFLIAAIVGVSFSFWDQHESAIAKSMRAAANSAAVLAKHAELTTRTIDFALLEIANRQNMAAADEASFRKSMVTRENYDFLVHRLSQLPEVSAIGVVDKDGETLVSTRAWPPVNLNLADREYFTEQRDNPVDLYVSRPFDNRVNGETHFVFSRRLENSDGKFLGVIWASIRPEQFLRVKDAISSITGEALTFLRSDGTVIMRFPTIGGSTGAKMPPDSAWYESVATGGGNYRSSGIFEPKPRWVTVRPLEHYPLVLDVSVADEAVLFAWRERAYLTAESVFAVLLGFGLLLHLVRRQLRVAIDSEAQLKDNEGKLRKLAHYDSLTGLGNRTLFLDRLDQFLARLKSDGEEFSLLIIDIDHFKGVNDSYGHPIGDELLIKIGNLLAEASASGDVVKRLGGDEFAILHRMNGPSDTSLMELIDRLFAAIQSPISVDGHSMKVGLSIGIAKADGSINDTGELLKRADLALYRAKADGRGCFRFFEQQMHDEWVTRAELANELRQAIAEKKLDLWLQPIICATTGHVQAMEALTRWNHPLKGMIPPGLFVPLAEGFGFVGELDAYVLDRACREAIKWPSGVKIAVNISAIQVSQGSLLNLVRTTLEKSGLEPSRLEIEITETAILKDSTRSLSTLQDLHSLGVHIALDDFGTGYSSLSFLCKYPFDKIKIDKSFVDLIGMSQSADAVIAATVGIARSLNARTTAEGVETREQMLLLQAAGVVELQGYYLGRPNPAERWHFVGPDVELLEPQVEAA